MMIRKGPLVAVLLLAVAALPVCDSKTADEPAKETSEVVAYVGEEPITRAELEEVAATGLKKLEQERYDLLANALDSMVLQRLVIKAAEDRGITTDELARIEIESKVVEPTHAEIESFYEANKHRAGGRTLDEVGNTIKKMIRDQRVQQRQVEFYNALKAQAGFRNLLEPPRTEVSIPAGAPVLGPVDAPITIIEFADYQCPYCRRVHPGLSRLLAEYKDKVRYVFRDYPLANHNRAVPASVAARCAGEQGKFWDYHNNLMEMTGSLSDDDLMKRAADLGLEAGAFNTCFTSGRHTADVQAGFTDGQAVGVTGTPSFFINGRMVVGAKPYQDLKKVVDEELARSAEKTEG